MFIPVYNTDLENAARYLKDFRVEMNPRVTFISNFTPAYFDVVRFYNVHVFLEAAFTVRKGYSLKALLACLWALQEIVLFPAQFFDFEREEDEPLAADDPMLPTVINFFQRGYGLWLAGGEKTIVGEIMSRLEVFNFALRDVSEPHVAACIPALALSKESQDDVALWSGGPRFPLVPFADGFVVDLQGFPRLLYSAFVGIRDAVGERGTVFEEELRLALDAKGFMLEKNGEIINTAGAAREIDVSVRIGDDLVLLECRAMERPLDFDIGKPQTMDRRKNLLGEKIDQALTLREFVVAHPKGANYDFSWAKRVACFVISPFVEWLWDETPRLWFKRGLPRILSADEAFELLEQWKKQKQIPIEGF